MIYPVDSVIHLLNNLGPMGNFGPVPLNPAQEKNNNPERKFIPSKSLHFIANSQPLSFAPSPLRTSLEALPLLRCRLIAFACLAQFRLASKKLLAFESVNIPECLGDEFELPKAVFQVPDHA